MLPFMSDVEPVDTEAESVRSARAQAPDVEAIEGASLDENTSRLDHDSHRTSALGSNHDAVSLTGSECCSHTTGWQRTTPLRSLISAQLTS